ncbi:16S rRNA (cytidine1402-2'-O)-methyltransferase [Amphiplicatus metriothermophilus]|uniref:Ribosomal RNA small subunit methyltransferase I n=2 Tax=Amphiplicatus metriothermophilus TaxID=1519374 RepID=A0A239PJJ8_9PROT|nr:16S rRNA (cytidine1402-2'-O)-methyltransferase [Amphiplicatus metriothermophilus]
MALDPGLYVAATPIGNLADVTFRVVEALKAADLILCEDTRRTAKLCAAYGIETPRAPYHEHNAARVLPGVIEKLKAGARVCLVSDAGTPLISDPGYRLVRAARDAGVTVIPLPGPSAAVAALSVAGAPTDRFLFAGFPPAKAAARRRFFEGLAAIDATLVFYESPARLAESLAAMAAAFGDRPAAVARELTKLHEEVREGRLAALAADYAEAPPKGEIAVVVHPPAQAELRDDSVDVDALLCEALERMSLKDAATSVAAASGRARKEVYARALALKGARR